MCEKDEKESECSGVAVVGYVCRSSNYRINPVRMKGEYKTPLQEALGQLKVCQVEDVKDEIRLEMGWSPSTLYSRMAGIRKTKKAEHRLLSELFRKYEIEYKAGA